MLLSSLPWVVLFIETSWPSAKAIEVSKLHHNSRTKFCIELSLVQNRDIICIASFRAHSLVCAAKNDVTDRQTTRLQYAHNDRHTNELLYASWLHPPSLRYNYSMYLNYHKCMCTCYQSTCNSSWGEWLSLCFVSTMKRHYEVHEFFLQHRSCHQMNVYYADKWQ